MIELFPIIKTFIVLTLRQNQPTQTIPKKIRKGNELDWFWGKT